MGKYEVICQTPHTKNVVPEIRVALSSKLSSVLSESAGCFVFRHPACKLTQLQRRFGLWHSNKVLVLPL